MTDDVFWKRPYGPWKKSRQYYNVIGARCGVMVCCSCQSPITSGWYSVRQNPEGEYSGHLHRNCSVTDEQWAKIDKHLGAQRTQEAAFVEACKEFRDRWQIGDLDKYIEGGE